MIEIEIEKLGTFKLPENWSEVNTKIFIKLMKIIKSIDFKNIEEDVFKNMEYSIKILSILFKIDEDELSEHLGVPSLIKLINMLSWMSETENMMNEKLDFKIKS